MSRLGPPYSEAAIESAARQYVEGRGMLTWELAVAICWQLLTYIDVERAFAEKRAPPPARPVLRAIKGGRRRRRARPKRPPRLRVIDGGRSRARGPMDAPPL